MNSLLYYNYEKEDSPGTLFEGFETSGDWTPGGDVGGSWAVNSDNVIQGTNSADIVAPSGGGYFATKVISKSFNNDNLFSYWVYLPTFDDATNSFSVGIYLTPVTNFSRFFLANVPTNTFHKGWNKILLRRSDFTVGAGSPAWSETMVRLRIRGNADDGESTMHVDNFVIGEYTRPRIIITFDDGWANQHTEAFSYMWELGLRGTAYVIGELVDTENYMTLDQLKELYNAGWDICTHGLNNLTGLADVEACETEIALNMDYITDNNLSRNNSHLHYAYPEGGVNQNAIDALDNLNFLTARTIIDRVQANVVDEAYFLTRQAIINTTTLATAKGYIDRVIETGGCLILNFHRIVETPTVDTEWGISDFQSLMDYLNTKQESGVLDNLTITEWYNKVT